MSRIPFFAFADRANFAFLDRPGRSTPNMLVIAEELRGRGAGLRVLNLGGARTEGTRDQARASDSTQRGCCVHERVIERVSDIKRLRRVAHGDWCVRSTSCASRWGRGPVPSWLKQGKSLGCSGLSRSEEALLFLVLMMEKWWKRICQPGSVPMKRRRCVRVQKR